MFKEGDKVVGISDRKYSITVRGWVGIVTDVRDKMIKVVDPNIPTDTFLVESKYFKLLEEVEPIENEVVTLISESLYK